MAMPQGGWTRSIGVALATGVALVASWSAVPDAALAARGSAPTHSTASLRGETLSVDSLEVDCSPGSGGASFDTSSYFGGIATGPYPGSFAEHFAMTTDNSGTSGSGQVTTFTAEFEIDADDGTVITGTKTFRAGIDSGTGRCQRLDPGTTVGSVVVSGDGVTSGYSAQIARPDATTSTDLGVASTSFIEEVDFLANGTQTQTHSFTETFGDSQDVRPGKGCGDKNHVHEREGECRNTFR